MDNEELIYSLNVYDVQNVAKEVFDRTLEKNEIKIIKKYVEENIAWYDAIVNAIHKYISEEIIHN